MVFLDRMEDEFEPADMAEREAVSHFLSFCRAHLTGMIPVGPPSPPPSSQPLPDFDAGPPIQFNLDAEDEEDEDGE